MVKENLSIEVPLDQLHDSICSQGIASDDTDSAEVPYFYLAALALGCKDDDEYDVNDTLMEFIRNSPELGLSRDDVREIEELLR